jgi:hypothetical protein
MIRTVKKIAEEQINDHAIIKNMKSLLLKGIPPYSQLVTNIHNDEAVFLYVVRIFPSRCP